MNKRRQYIWEKERTRFGNWDKRVEEERGSKWKKERQRISGKITSLIWQAAHNNKKARLWVMKNNNSTQLNSNCMYVYAYTTHTSHHITSQPHSINPANFQAYINYVYIHKLLKRALHCDGFRRWTIKKHYLPSTHTHTVYTHRYI